MRFDVRIAAVFIVVALTGFYWGQGSVPSGQPALIGLFQDNEPFVTDYRVKDADCRADGPYPDHECTPGAVFPDVTAGQVCVSGYSKTVRKVSESLKKRVYRSYDIAYPPPFGSYELDHFIPLSLGGNNDIANLWPFAAEPRPGFIEKDLVVNYLRQNVCGGGMTLQAAQRAIATYWVQVYESIDASEKAELKKLYPSWAEIRR
ncbi:MAG: hypothetical protein A2941_03125 [Candidatus Yanofskybacteria bacterium RIFCSPLOWO2_01_FULL_49_17]|uniref:Uncharacterized protein n=1 Tax=Candidatus Yanofskybacteria bacterium RIFCSPLOWO2_01_FULL_49_17 TaxID=1802700 RepID=A0A1F8GRI7_9BACT|nr:MAG: hypothetical protein A2941_03125 [Candidatus Yanofskybacteria bacterium RIFCSPLOWO2_01_FULL_49_17]